MRVFLGNGIPVLSEAPASLLCPDFLFTFFPSSETAKHEDVEETHTRLFDWPNVMGFFRYGGMEKDTGKKSTISREKERVEVGKSEERRNV